MMKKRKCKKYKGKNDYKPRKNSKVSKEPEVYILPPDVLHNLGINLNSLKNGSFTDSTPSIATSCKNSCQNENDEQINDSILQTANLMTTSVFMSPTFVTNNSSFLQEELEIASIMKDTERKEFDIYKPDNNISGPLELPQHSSLLNQLATVAERFLQEEFDDTVFKDPEIIGSNNAMHDDVSINLDVNLELLSSQLISKTDEVLSNKIKEALDCSDTTKTEETLPCSKDIDNEINNITMPLNGHEAMETHSKYHLSELYENVNIETVDSNLSIEKSWSEDVNNVEQHLTHKTEEIPTCNKDIDNEINNIPMPDSSFEEIKNDLNGHEAMETQSKCHLSEPNENFNIETADSNLSIEKSWSEDVNNVEQHLKHKTEEIPTCNKDIDNEINNIPMPDSSFEEIKNDLNGHEAMETQSKCHLSEPNENLNIETADSNLSIEKSWSEDVNNVKQHLIHKTEEILTCSKDIDNEINNIPMPDSSFEEIKNVLIEHEAMETHSKYYLSETYENVNIETLDRNLPIEESWSEDVNNLEQHLTHTNSSENSMICNSSSPEMDVSTKICINPIIQSTDIKKMSNDDYLEPVNDMSNIDINLANSPINNSTFLEDVHLNCSDPYEMNQESHDKDRELNSFMKQNVNNQSLYVKQIVIENNQITHSEEIEQDDESIELTKIIAAVKNSSLNNLFKKDIKNQNINEDSYDDHHDEAYSSDSNIEEMVNMTSSEKSNKIKIVLDQIISPKQHKHINVNFINFLKDSLVPIDINSVLPTRNKTLFHRNKTHIDPVHDSTPCNSTLMFKELHSSNQEDSEIRSNTNFNISKKNISDETISQVKLIDGNYRKYNGKIKNLLGSSECSKHINSKNNEFCIKNVSLNKQNLIYELKENNVNLDKLTNGKINEIAKDIQYPIPYINQTSMTPRGCVHGVEKPGGTLSVSHSKSPNKKLKVYTNVKKNKKEPKQNVERHLLKLRRKLNCQNIDLENVVLQPTDRTEKFCLCCDFGLLDFYDNDNSYEHIHFWVKDSVSCEAELLYSIYNEDYDLSNFVESEEKKGCHMICWSNLREDSSSDSKKSKLTEAKGILRKAHEGSSEAYQIVENETDLSIAKKKIKNSNVLHKKAEPLKNSNKTTKKRLLSSSKTDNNDQVKMKEAKKKAVKCNVCHRLVADADWRHHASSEHCFIAWKDGETFILENLQLVKNLKDKLKSDGILKCTFCGFTEKRSVTKFMKHAQDCIKKKVADDSKAQTDEADSLEVVVVVQEESNLDVASPDEPNAKEATNAVPECGVCGSRVDQSEWMSHIRTCHGYLAWKHGEKPLDLEDENAVLKHLQTIKREIDGFECGKCGVVRTNAKGFLKHSRKCSPSQDNDRSNSTIPDPDTKLETSQSDLNVSCGTCEESMEEAQWMSHMRSAHQYLAWKRGEEPIDFSNEADLNNHLKQLMKRSKSLQCPKCAKPRKTVDGYLAHLAKCTEPVLADMKVKCAVCEKEMERQNWTTHIEAHHYMAWEHGEDNINFDDEYFLNKHLRKVIKEIGVLTCYKCKLSRKSVCGFLDHIKKCESDVSSEGGDGSPSAGHPVTCGVCEQEMPAADWAAHSQAEHGYLAWRQGEAPLDTSSADDVSKHLRKALRRADGLACAQCGVARKSVAGYLQHAGRCAPPRNPPSQPRSPLLALQSPSAARDERFSLPAGGAVGCGACGDSVAAEEWPAHIRDRHDYLALADTHEPLDFTDETVKLSYLQFLCKQFGFLTCSRCGLSRKYAKKFLQHLEACKPTRGNPFSVDGNVKCSVCFETVSEGEWKEHCFDKHYNIAWEEGGVPIDVRNFNTIRPFLMEYLNKNKLICNVCGTQRISLNGFYAHIIVCGKSEEEVDKFMDCCDECGERFLCVYRVQHLNMHAQAQAERERKAGAAAKRQARAQRPAPGGERRAAQASVPPDAPSTCRATATEEPDESYEPADGDSASDEDEGEGSAVDSDASSAGNRRERSRQAAPAPAFPFPVDDLAEYHAQGLSDFFESNFGSEEVFPQWKACRYRELSADQAEEYAPSVMESCQIQLNSKQWTTLKRFEATQKAADKFHGTALFGGGCLQCLSWAPPAGCASEEAGRGGAFLAVSCHRGPDVSRFGVNELAGHRGLVQIWDFGSFDSLPHLAMGIAHDFGTVWAMDWCPSGARSPCAAEGPPGPLRLGLLALACSDGVVYVLSVPHPSSVLTNGNVYVELSPVAELRLATSAEGGRRLFQATSLDWSKAKGHAEVLVGYADGHVAAYDLGSPSPLLRRVRGARGPRGAVEEIGPFREQRSSQSCVGVVRASGSGARGVELAGGPGGSALQAGGPRGPRVLSAVAPLDAQFLWPSPQLGVAYAPQFRHTSAGLGWWEQRARRGNAAVLAPLGRAGLLAWAAPPLLWAVRPHDQACHKRVCAVVRQSPLGARPVRPLARDGLAVRLAPSSAQQSVGRFGLELRSASVSEREVARQLGPCAPAAPAPEAFPLAEPVALAFCPSAPHLQRLAVGVFCGVVFVTPVARQDRTRRLVPF